jgi:hypothetical protein
MAQFQVERTIQWYGIIQVPPEYREYLRWWRLTADILEAPYAEYRNVSSYNIPNAYMGAMQTSFQDRLLQIYQYRWYYQLWEGHNPILYNYALETCSLDAILKSIENLGLSLGAIPIIRNNPIRAWAPNYTMPDTFLIKMVSENAIVKLRLEGETQEACSVDNTTPPPPPPPPPPPEQPFPPGGSGNNKPPISPPYTEPDDDGKTYKPEPDDGGDDYPIGQDCAQFRIVAIVRADTNPPEITGEVTVFAPIQAEPYIENGTLFVNCAGDTRFDECGAPRPVAIILNNVIEVISIQITPV